MAENDALFVAIKYEIYPNDKQKIQLAQTFGCARKVYNMGLELQNELYDGGEKRMSKTDLNNYCNRYWKWEFPYLSEVDKFALTNAIYDLEDGFTNFFEKRANKPKFKSKRDHRYSYTTNFTNNNIKIRYQKTNLALAQLSCLNLIGSVLIFIEGLKKIGALKLQRYL